MVSSRSRTLYLLPIKFVTLLHVTPVVYDQETGQLKVSTGFTAFQFRTAAGGAIVVMFGLIAIHALNIYNGLVPLDELLMASLMFPNYLMGIGLFATLLMFTPQFVHLLNNIWTLDADLRGHFGVAAKDKDGTEVPLLVGILSIAFVLPAIGPGVFQLLYMFKGFFHHIRFESFEANIVLGGIAAVAVAGNLIMLFAVGMALYMFLHSAAHWLHRMRYHSSMGHSDLKYFLKTNRKLLIVHRQMMHIFDFISPIMHVAGYALCFNVVFCLIYLHENLKLLIIYLFGLIALTIILVFRSLGKTICAYTDASAQFIESYARVPRDAARGSDCDRVDTSTQKQPVKVIDLDEDRIESVWTSDRSPTVAIEYGQLRQRQQPPANGSIGLTLTLEEVKLLATCFPLKISVAAITYDHLTAISHMESNVFQNVINALLAFR